MVLTSVGVTGSNGMLGRHLVPALTAAGFKVIASSHHGSAEIETRLWDLSQWKSFDELDELFFGAKAIIHAGAMVPKTSQAIDEGQAFNVNVRACLNLGEWALSRSMPIVHISGGIVYVEPEQESIEETAATGYSGFGGFYGLTKLLAEDIFHRMRERGLRVAILRPSSIYGTGLDQTKMINVFLSIAARDGTIELTPPVDDKIDLIHAADVASSVVAILRTELWETFNISSGFPATVVDIAEACMSVTGKGKMAVKADKGLDVRKPISRLALNSERAQKYLGWSPRIRLERGIAALLENRVLVSPARSFYKFAENVE